MAYGAEGTVLIAGGLGLVGRAALEHFEFQEGWDVVALARRAPDFPTRARFLPVDLTDPADCRERLTPLRGVTRVVYAALFEKPELGKGWLEADQIATNLAMLTNLMDAVEPGNPGLRHVALLQGTKAYGVHLGQMPIPGKESAPRHIHPNFYWAQEDFIRARQAAAGWSFTIFRPQAIVGFALGSAMNLLSAIGAYAAISRELGLPLVYPGSGQRYTEATDARLLARAIAWAGEDRGSGQPDLQRHQRRRLPVAGPVPGGGPALRHGAGDGAPDAPGRRHGRQGAGLAAPRGAARAAPLQLAAADRQLLAVRRLRLQPRGPHRFLAQHRQDPPSRVPRLHRHRRDAGLVAR
jgi:nucleoside-diphosphate-sugar epimerase